MFKTNRILMLAALAGACLYRAEGEASGSAPATAPAAPETAAPKAPKVERLSANGITRPAEGTATGRVWAIADELSKAAGAPIARAEVMTKGVAEGLNTATIATQYGKWRVFNGLKGVTAPKEPKPPKAPKAPKAPKVPAAPAVNPAVEGAAGAAPSGTTETQSQLTTPAAPQA